MVKPYLALGLMSGTSADGVDASLLSTDGDARIEWLEDCSIPYDASLRERLLTAAQQELPAMNWLSLEQDLTTVHIDACQALLTKAGRHGDELDVIGFHGHTLRHDAAQKITWQIGDASRLAVHFATRVVHDFRRADIAAGGQGAPLAPLYHQQLLGGIDKPALILNLGGVGNITWIGENGTLVAGDTGPGCGLLDAWVSEKTGQPFDEDGRLARQGQVDDDLVRKVLEHEYFQRDLPKSADRFEFGFVDVSDLSVEDGASTLCAVTVAAVADAVFRLPDRPTHCWVTGGGSKHPIIMAMLKEQLGHAEPIEALGYQAAFVESQCFAWLAVRRLRNLWTTDPGTTGCSRPTSGGAIVDGRL